MEITPPTAFSASTFCSAPAVMATSTEAAKTMLEWPMAKNRPTLTGRWPSCISLRVTLSMAAMWSASIAWRRPKP